MPLFSNSSSFVGVDVDTHSIKVVELKSDRGRPRLVTYGYFDHDIERKVADDAAGQQETAGLIREVCKKARVTSKVAISSLPAPSVFSSVMTLPKMSSKELAQAVRWQAKKIVPLPLEEMNLDWEVLSDDATAADRPAAVTSATAAGAAAPAPGAAAPQPGIAAGYRGFMQINRKKDVENIRVLLTAAPKDLVKKFLGIFQTAGLQLLALDTESFTLIRSLVGVDNATVMIVDMDFTVTNVIIVSRGIPYLNRTVGVGGLNITREIAKSLNINLRRAEQFKYDIGVSAAAQGSSGIPQLITTALQPVVDEIKYSLNLSRGQGRGGVDKIILTGGSSLLQNLPNYLSQALQLRVFLGDPWARVVYPEELKPALDEIGPRFSVAIGLAMKEIA